MHGQWAGGKGSATRHGFSKKKYDIGHDRAFGKSSTGSPFFDKIRDLDEILNETNGCVEDPEPKDKTMPFFRPEDLQKVAPPGDFTGFPKIPRLYRDIIITEKIDGTNAQIVVPKDPSQRVWAASRKRWITPEDDNFGFAAWVRDHEEELRQLGPGRHFGEWWGKGIQRGYGLDYRRFSLFNVSRWKEGVPPYTDWRGANPYFEGEEKRIRVPDCCHVVAIVYAGPFYVSSIRATILALRTRGSAAVPGFMKPEGIVIFHQQSGHLFKITLENDEKPKGKQDGRHP